MSQVQGNEKGVLAQEGDHGEERRDQWLAGVFLLAIGLVALALQYADSLSLGRLALPILGAIFILWGFSTRETGFFVPGGVLSGIGLGVYLVTGPYASVGEQAMGGVFLLAFALGWLLIAALAWMVEGSFHPWPLFPSGAMALIGGGLLVGGEVLETLVLIFKAWPLALIAVGVYLLVRRRD